MYCLF